MKDRQEVFRLEESIAARMALRQGHNPEAYMVELAFSHVKEGNYDVARRISVMIGIRNPARDFINAMIYSRQGELFLADLSYRQTIHSAPDFAKDIEKLREVVSKLESPEVLEVA